VLLLLSSFYVVTETDRWEPLRHKQVRWAADIARHTAFDEGSAFVLHYAQQMRFVADRRVIERVDTSAKVAEVSGTRRVFAPLAHPFGDATALDQLLSIGPATLCGSLVAFGLEEQPPESRGRLGRQELGAGVSLETLVYTVVPTRDGSTLLALAPKLSALPRVQPGDTLEWHVRFLGKEGAVLGAASMPADASASYLIVAPKAWLEQSGRAELALRLCTSDAAAVGRVKRMMRLALRFLTLRARGNPEPVIRSLGQVEFKLRPPE
jgi:hypothetical protein